MNQSFLIFFFFYLVYDLSTSSKCGMSAMIPSIRVGHLRLKVLFSAALKLDLTCLLHCEFPATAYLNKSGQVTGSYI